MPKILHVLYLFKNSNEFAANGLIMGVVLLLGKALIAYVQI